MSSTRRSDARLEFDDYPTPGWCVDRLLDAYQPKGIFWLEPCAGSGQIIKRVSARIPNVRWNAWDIQEKYRKPLVDLGLNDSEVTICDSVHRAYNFSKKTYDVVITNPPYSQAFEMLRVFRHLAPVVIFLLRRNFLASQARWEYLRRDMPAEYCLPDRPKFVNGRSDSCEYAWMVWASEKSPYGTTHMLDLTPLEERKGDETSCAGE